MTICNNTEVCDINEHSIPCGECDYADYVYEYEDKDLGMAACRCSECIEEIEGAASALKNSRDWL